MSNSGQPDAERSWRRFLKWGVLGVVALVAVGYAAIFFYANVLNDSPDALGEGDLGSALAETTPTDTVDVAVGVDTTAVDPQPAESTPADTTVSDTSIGTEPADGFDGEWKATDASEFGYRVEEVLAGVNTTAVGRSNEIDATLTIDGTTATAIDVEVPVETIESDESRRDNRFRGAIMNVDEFPTATFVLTEPIDFGSIPTGDETITATATGDLTLRGVTNTVTFGVTAQTTGGRIGVLGSIPVVFADYGIDNPSFGQIKTEDHGLVEFVLVFER